MVSIKKERRTKAAPTTPTKGRLEQHLADAPIRERGPSTASKHQGPISPGWSFCGKQKLDARASFQIVLWPEFGRKWFSKSDCKRILLNMSELPV